MAEKQIVPICEWCKKPLKLFKRILKSPKPSKKYPDICFKVPNSYCPTCDMLIISDGKTTVHFHSPHDETDRIGQRILIEALVKTISDEKQTKSKV